MIDKSLFWKLYQLNESVDSILSFCMLIRYRYILSCYQWNHRLESIWHFCLYLLPNKTTSFTMILYTCVLLQPNKQMCICADLEVRIL